MALDQLKQIMQVLELKALMLQTLVQNVVQRVLVRLDKLPDLEARMSSESGDVLSRFAGVPQGLGGLVAEPLYDRYPMMTEDHERIMCVPHDSCKLGFQDRIQYLDYFFLIHPHKLDQGLERCKIPIFTICGTIQQ